MYKIIKAPWFLWLLVSSFGSAIGFTLSESFGTGAERDYYLPLFLLVEIALSGLLIGLGQWMILRTKLNDTWGWIPATTIGLPLGFLIGFFVSDLLLGSFYSNEWVQTFIMASIAGVFTGSLQWLALRRKMKDAARWISASAFSWGIGITATGFIFDSYFSDIDLGYLFAPFLGMLVGALVGIISGIFVESTLIQTDQKGVDSFSHAS